MNKDDEGKFTYQRSVSGGQIYNFYLCVDGEIKIDESQKKTANGKANWVFVPLSDKNKEKAASIFNKPLSFRMLKLKRLHEEIDLMRSFNSKEESDKLILKKKAVNYNKLLITVN